jgi:hypothetical protein
MATPVMDVSCRRNITTLRDLTSESLLFLFKSYAIPKHSHLLGILALNILITSTNSSLLPSFTLHAPMHGHKEKHMSSKQPMHGQVP